MIVLSPSPKSAKHIFNINIHFHKIKNTISYHLHTLLRIGSVVDYGTQSIYWMDYEQKMLWYSYTWIDGIDGNKSIRDMDQEKWCGSFIHWRLCSAGKCSRPIVIQHSTHSTLLTLIKRNRWKDFANPFLMENYYLNASLYLKALFHSLSLYFSYSIYTFCAKKRHSNES